MLIKDQKKRHVLVYFVCYVLIGPELTYLDEENMDLALIIVYKT